MNSRMLGLSKHWETLSKVVEGLSPLTIKPNKPTQYWNEDSNNEVVP